MQILIEISEEEYRKVKDGRCPVSVMRDAIRNGKPLPKGHGRLIDYNDVVNVANHYISCDVPDIILEDDGTLLPTIIEADKERDND